jgi:hypothetical protein
MEWYDYCAVIVIWLFAIVYIIKSLDDDEEE